MYDIYEIIKKWSYTTFRFLMNNLANQQKYDMDEYQVFLLLKESATYFRTGLKSCFVMQIEYSGKTNSKY